MKKAILFSVSLVFLLSILTGCGGQKEVSTSSDKDKTYTIRFAHAYSTAAQHHKVVTWYKEQVEKRSNGKIKVDIYPAAQLMPIDQEISAILDGRIQADLTVTSTIANLDPSAYIFDMPFLFNTTPGDLSKLKKFVKSETFKNQVIKKFEQKGLKVWPAVTDDAATFNTTSKAVAKADDVAGLKMRILGGRYAEQVAKALGYSAVTISGAELPTALMQGTVDGAITYPIYIRDSKLPLKNVSLIPLNYQAVCPLNMSATFYNSLPKDLQKVLDDVGNEMFDWAAKEVESKVNDALKDMEQNMGIKVIKLPDQEMAKLKEKVSPIWDKFAQDVSGGKQLIEEAKKL